MDAHCTQTDIKKLQNYKVEREVKNRAELENSIQGRKGRIGLQ
jgi:hypothetical protein